MGTEYGSTVEYSLNLFGVGFVAYQAKFLYYEKPWMKRKRLKQQRIYQRKKQGVDNLIKYIHYVQDKEKEKGE
jgi:hypothetical protein